MIVIVYVIGLIKAVFMFSHYFCRLIAMMVHVALHEISAIVILEVVSKKLPKPPSFIVPLSPYSISSF